MSGSTDPEVLWTPPNAGKTPMDIYRRHVESKFQLSLPNTHALHKWSVKSPHDFWLDMYSYLNLNPPLPPSLTKAYDDSLPMSAVPAWFEGHNLNFAENSLFSNPDPNAVAIIGLREGDPVRPSGGEQLTWAQLRERVRLVASALKRSGVEKGDRVAALVSTSIWCYVFFLATASIGAIFTCISPDLGVEGCVARLKQVTPKILFCDGDMTYRGKRTSIVEKIDSILGALTEKPSVFVIPVAVKQNMFESVDNFLSKARKEDKLEFERVPFGTPLIICYSSGTTGAPKCIVHAHGLILNLRKVSTMTNSLRPGEVVMQYTSTSWVMFYIMSGHLATGATVIAYDGSPMYPDVRQLLRILSAFGVTYFGSSPRYLAELEMARCVPKTEFDLSKLRMINTTGAPLALDQHRWFYKAFPPTVHLNNTAGGTDSATTFIGGDPCGPLREGEMQCITLGIDADVADAETGASIVDSGGPGELVIRQPFPSMPTFFWGDDGGKIYKASYFERFDKVDCWAQHDWVSRNPKTLGWTMSGRSDGVLNPSGIRFGSGEVYGIVEGPAFNAEIAETLCVGRRRRSDRDEQVFLFVRMLPGHQLTDDLKARLKKAIATGLSPRHVPRFMIQLDAIPITINGKKVEIAVKQIISGKDVKPSSTVANPDTLKQFVQFRDIEEQPRAKL